MHNLLPSLKEGFVVGARHQEDEGLCGGRSAHPSPQPHNVKWIKVSPVDLQIGAKTCSSGFVKCFLEFHKLTIASAVLPKGR